MSIAICPSAFFLVSRCSCLATKKTIGHTSKVAYAVTLVKLNWQIAYIYIYVGHGENWVPTPKFLVLPVASDFASGPIHPPFAQADVGKIQAQSSSVEIREFSDLSKFGIQEGDQCLPRKCRWFLKPLYDLWGIVFRSVQSRVTSIFRMARSPPTLGDVNVSPMLLGRWWLTWTTSAAFPNLGYCLVNCYIWKIPGRRFCHHTSGRTTWYVDTVVI